VALGADAASRVFSRHCDRGSCRLRADLKKRHRPAIRAAVKFALEGNVVFRAASEKNHSTRIATGRGNAPVSLARAIRILHALSFLFMLRFFLRVTRKYLKFLTLLFSLPHHL
jgi:hypothetical protein